MRWLLIAALIACSSSKTTDVDALIAEFHGVERASLRAFNDALHQQKAGQIDEKQLAATIRTAVIPPWHALRERVQRAASPELAGMSRYLAAREDAWDAYATALLADSDALAQPYLDRYHQADHDADRYARELATQLSRRSGP